jgi:hypothetical protein
MNGIKDWQEFSIESESEIDKVCPSEIDPWWGWFE